MVRQLLVIAAISSACCIGVESAEFKSSEQFDNTGEDGSAQCSRDESPFVLDQKGQCEKEPERILVASRTVYFDRNEFQADVAGEPFAEGVVGVMSESEKEVDSQMLDKLPDVDELLKVEKEMLEYMSLYIHNETARLKTLAANLKYWQEVSNYSMADPEEYLSVYLNCFHLLKRMALDIQPQLLKYSLFDEDFSQEDLNQWDRFSSDHYLKEFVRTHPVLLEHLSELDAHGLLMVLETLPNLQVPDVNELSKIVSDVMQAPLDFDEALASKEDIGEALKSIVDELKAKGTEVS